MRVLGVSIAVVAVVVGLLLSPNLWALAVGFYHLWLPRTVRDWLPLALAVLAGSILEFRPGFIAETRWERADVLAERVLGRPMPVVLAGLAALWLACWVPHYLTWPWWADMDHFAMMALAWDAGILPYRDAIDYSFPGPVYGMWAIGKVFGWGRTAPAFALDAGLLIALGFAMAAWSLRRFRTRAPGLCAYVAVVSMYLNLNYALVAQRDWHATLLVVFGLMALEGWPGRGGRLASAALLGASLGVRPHAVLFIPAMISAIAEAAPGRRALLCGVLEWSAAAAAAAVLTFSPLLVAGVFDDFVRSLAYVRPGGAYNRNSPSDFVARLREGVFAWRYLTILVALAVVARFGPPPLARTARTWALALAGVAFYKPLSPVAHDYLDLPRMLLEAVCLGPLVAWVLALTRLAAPTRLFVVVCVLGGSLTIFPLYCAPGRSLEAIVEIARGQTPSHSPPGCSEILKDTPRPSCWYPWRDYCAVLDHLRRSTRPETRVANLLRHDPFPTINGPAGRLTPFRSVGGLQWLRWVGTEREPEFARALEDAGADAVVVWAPEETRIEAKLTIEDMIAVIHRCYRPEAKFGIIEVWRRATGDCPTP